MDLQTPTKKMSKTEDSPQGTILLKEDPKAIAKKIKSALTDSETEVRHDRERKPGISNLIEIYGAVTGSSIPDIEKEFAGQQYGPFKTTVADAVVEFLRPVQARYAELAADPAEVDRRLGLGADIAEAKAEAVLGRAMKAAGLLPRPRSRRADVPGAPRRASKTARGL